MRGKIIQYNGADGSGTIVADGKQYRFALVIWRGDKAPALNKSVEMELDGDTVTSVTAVGDDVLMKERAAQMSGRLGAAWKQASAAVQSARSGSATGDTTSPGATASVAPVPTPFADIPIVGSIVARSGLVIPIAWFLFLLGSVAFATVSVSMSMGAVHHAMSVTMFNTGGGQGGAGGFFVRLLLILGYVSIFVPFIWRDRRAWLALLLPIIAVVWAWIHASQLLDEAHSRYASLMQYQGAAANGISLNIGHGFGFWLALIMAIIVAVAAVMRYLDINAAAVAQPAAKTGSGSDTSA